MGRWFGTDGVRGVANRDLSPELAFRLGRAGAAVLLKDIGHERPRVLIGRDTRVSGPLLEAALVAGITSVGADVVLLGILPTPAVAHLTKALGADAAAMISASHNPVPDNGIKFFASTGFKLLDELEEEIESLLDRPGDFAGATSDGLPRPTGVDIGTVTHYANGAAEYADALTKAVPLELSGLRVVVDCANGAAHEVAPALLRRLGADVIALNDRPDGARINVECGSTHPDLAGEVVRRHGAQVGLAFDGDADRVIAVDEKGNVVNGDHILAVCGLHALKAGRLPKRRIAATVYSNLGLRLAFERAGGSVAITKPGDRYVLEAMLQEGLMLGGEQSGHVLFLEASTTGDGILTGLQLLKVMCETERPLSELTAQMPVLPQELVNVRVRDKGAVASNENVQRAVQAAEAALGRNGRVLIRPSGTEPLVRIMVEAEDPQQVKELAGRLAGVIQKELGA